MTSEPAESFVWIWLPDATEPVVAGRVQADGRRVRFTYGRSYLSNPSAIAIYDPELPLRRGTLEPRPDREIPGCLLDAGPDSWGQRIILDRIAGTRGRHADPVALGPLTYLVHAGSDRIGALDFQPSATEWLDRSGGGATLDELLRVADIVDAREPLSAELDDVLLHGTSIGGARPKALLDAGDRKLIAKFSSSSDTYLVVEAEFVAMELARRCGLDVARVEIQEALGRRVLLVERFDRVRDPRGWTRRAFVSALTMLDLPEMLGRYATYFDLARVAQERFTAPAATMRELFGRIVFNILCSNGDDHARNHGAFWDGRRLALTPAYDICPGQRTGASEHNQAMAIAPGVRESRLRACVDHASLYGLDAGSARELIDAQVEVIRRDWDEVTQAAGLTMAQRDDMWQRQFLNPYALDGYPA